MLPVYLSVIPLNYLGRKVKNRQRQSFSNYFSYSSLTEFITKIYWGSENKKMNHDWKFNLI